MTAASIKIRGAVIGEKHPPFIIAEMSGNHNRSLKRALDIVDAAAFAGAHALKIQTYTADTMTIDKSDGEFFIRDKKSLWKGKSLYSLYKEAHTPWEWHRKIFERCRQKGLIGFSTPFDATSVEFLEALKVPMYKVASLENIDLPLIRKIAKTKKPILVSTGLATRNELKETVKWVRNAGNAKLVLLKCTSAYPASCENANLKTLPDMKRRFGCLVGLSDHSHGWGVSIAAVGLGAVVIEKHLTLSRKDGGVDSAFSMEPDEMKQLVEETRKAWEAMGKTQYGPTLQEIPALQYRRSLYVVRDIKKGDILTSENVRSIRPGKGLPPKFFDRVVGKKANKKIKRGTALSLNLIR